MSKFFDGLVISTGQILQDTFAKVGVITHLSSQKKETIYGTFNSDTVISDSSYHADVVLEKPSLEVDIKTMEWPPIQGDLLDFEGNHYEITEVIHDSFGYAKLMLSKKRRA